MKLHSRLDWAATMVAACLSFAPAAAQPNKAAIDVSETNRPPTGSIDGSPPRIVQLSLSPEQRVVDNLGVGTLEITFDEGVSVPDGSVRVWGVRDGDVPISEQVYDPETRRLRVTLGRAITADIVTFVLDYSIIDLAGNELDGEALDARAPQLPTGDGLPGGRSVFRFEVLQGDANRDGEVNETDGEAILASLGQGQGDADFDALADLNRDGFVNVLDIAIWSGGRGGTLPEIDAAGPIVESISPDPDVTPLGDTPEVAVTYDQPLSGVEARDLFALTSQGALRTADSVALLDGGRTALFVFDPPLSRCEEHSLNLSNAFGNASGALAAVPENVPVIDGIAPTPVPTLDAFPLLTADEVVTLTGTALGATTVRVIGPEDVYVQPVVNDRFEVDVELPSDFLHTIFVSSVSPCGQVSAAATARITRDRTGPMINIDFPSPGQQITTDTVTVLGRVGDELSGQMGLTATVNGLPAEVTSIGGANGTFVAMGIPLTLGAQDITVFAEDALGNARSRSISVSRVEVQPGTPTIEAIAGDGQFGPVLTELPAPLEVRLTRPDGMPLVNKVVTFRVERNDGLLATEPDETANGDNFLQVFTDSQGTARAYWRLGSTAGAGGNRVSVESAGLVGTAYFCATGQSDPPSRILVGDMNNQRAEAGGPLPQPLIAYVTDGDAGNPVAGVPVTFSVVQGDGEFPDSGREYVALTGMNGRAFAPFTLGETPGLNSVTATFDDNSGLPAVFNATGIERIDGAATTLSGLVLDNANRPIGGALATLTVTLDFPSGPDTVILGPVESDADGRFSFDSSVLPPDALNATIPGGPAKVLVSGVFATSLGGEPITREWTFPYVGYDITLVEGAANTLQDPAWLPELDPANEVLYNGTQDVVLTVAGIEGLEFLVKAGSVTREDGSRPTPENPEVLRLNQVHFDEVPMPLPNGNAYPFAWTLQPKNTRFDPPIEVTLPNLTGLPAGSIAEVLQWNNDVAEFQTMGTGRVSADGSAITTEPGSGITVAGWGGAAPPPPPTGAVESCTIEIEGPGGETDVVRVEPGELFDLTATGGGTISSWAVLAATTLQSNVVTQQFATGSRVRYRAATTPGTTRVRAIGRCTDSGRVSDTIDIVVGPTTFNVDLVDLTDPTGPVLDSDLLSFSDLATNGGRAIGLTSDGTSRLLIRALPPGPGRVRFTVSAPANVDDFGQLRALTAQSFSQGPGPLVVEANTIEVADGQHVVLAVLQAPINPTRALFVCDVEFIDATSPDGAVSAETTIPIEVALPPVVLVHGLWADREGWTLQISSTRDVTRLEYANDKSFEDNAPEVGEGIIGAVETRRRRGFACSQADVIGHSMGGLLARKFASLPGNRRGDNQFAGYLNKLITIYSPHSGSERANQLTNSDGTLTILGSLLTSAELPGRADNGAVFDLRTDRTGLLLPPVSVPSHVIVGRSGPTGDPGDDGPSVINTANALLGRARLPWGAVLGAVFSFLLESEQTPCGGLANAVFVFGSAPNDSVVSVFSQLGGLSEPAVSYVDDFISGLHTSGTSSNNVAVIVNSLLEAPLDADPGTSRFAQGFARPAITPAVGSCAGLFQDLGMSLGSGDFIAITEPIAGDAFEMGGNVRVVVDVAPGSDLSNVVVGIADGEHRILTEAPYQTTLSLDPHFVGSTTVTAVAYSSASATMDVQTVQLNVVTQAALERITVLAGNSFALSARGIEVPTVEALYADGAVRLVSTEELSVDIGDSRVARLDPDRRIRAVGLGATNVTLEFAGVETDIEVVVNALPLDSNGDGFVDSADFAAFMQAAIASSDSNSFDDSRLIEVFDSNYDGLVNGLDYEIFLLALSAPQPDCNADGLPDFDQIFTAPMLDADIDGRLDECGTALPRRFTLGVNGRTTEVARDGSFRITGVPVTDSDADGLSDEFVQLTGTEEVDGVRRVVLSERVQIPINGSVELTNLQRFSTPPPTPVSLVARSAKATISRGETTQIEVLATFSDGTEADVTGADNFTYYVSSNLQTVSVSADGEVLALASGLAFVRAVNSNVATVRRINVADMLVNTTVTGTVLRPDGSPAAGAAIASPVFGGSTIADEDGGFRLELDVPVDATGLTVRASLDGFASSTSPSLSPLSDGFTDSGVLRLSTASSGPLFAAPTFRTGSRPSSIAIGDLDGDSIADLAVANSSSDSVSVLIGRGDGTFVPRVDYATGRRPQAIAIGDLDADGIADLGVANETSNSLSVLLGQGDGAFATREDYVTGDRPRSVAIDDLDGDGNADLVVANSSSNSVSVLLSLGDGTLAPRVDYATHEAPIFVAIGDLDGDGDSDLAVVNGVSDSVSVLLGLGDGTFEPRVDYATDSFPTSVAIGDVDGDGNADLAVTNNTDFSISVLAGIGDGTFAARMDYALGVRPRSVAIDDLDGDGNADLAVANDFSFSLLFGTGNGTFAPRVDYLTGDSPRFVAIGDLDGDRDADLAVANNGSNSVSVLLNLGDGAFASREDYSTGDNPVGVTTDDLDGDGDADLVVANFNSNSVSVLLGLGDGTFAVHGEYSTGEGPTSVSIGDLDGDGNADLAVANSISDSVSVLIGLGDGTFATGEDFRIGARRPQSIAIGDLDGNGNADLAVASSSPGSVFVLLGRGDGTFPTMSEYRTGNTSRSVAIGDLDHDGNADLAVANNSLSVSVLLGLGDGTFATRTDYPMGDRPQSLAIGDLDGDGKADLAVANDFSFSVLLGTGDGTFAPRVDFVADDFPRSVAISDLNGDGNADLISATSFSVSALLGRGDGTFAAQANYATGRNPVRVVIGDLDGDGNADLAVTNRDADSVSVLLNQRSGSPRFGSRGDVAESGEKREAGISQARLSERRAAFAADDPVVAVGPTPWQSVASAPSGANGTAVTSADDRTEPSQQTLHVGRVETAVSGETEAVQPLDDPALLSNPSGQRAVTRLDPAVGVLRAVLIEPDGAVRSIPTLGGPTSFARAINASGDVVGFGDTADGRVEGFVWSYATGETTPIGTFGGARSAAAMWYGDALALGGAETADGQTRAALWTAGGGLVDLNELAALPGIMLSRPLGRLADGRVLVEGSNHQGERVRVAVELQLFKTLAGDVTGDGRVDEQDMREAVLLIQSGDPAGDLDNDGRVTPSDFAVIARDMGRVAQEIVVEPPQLEAVPEPR